MTHSLFSIILSLTLCVTAFAETEKDSAQAYVTQVNLIMRKQWHPKPSDAPVKITLSWKIDRDGRVSNVKVAHPGADSEQSRLAMDALKRATPLPPLPAGMKNLDLNFTFETPRREPPLRLTLNQAMKRFGPPARQELKKKFAKGGLTYPPQKITMVAIKQERQIYLFAENEKPVLIGVYPLSTFSGKLGPKLRRGDLQIPEGIYRINGRDASFRLALKVKYPSDFDSSMALSDKRSDLGSDILVHHGTVSTGCLVLPLSEMQELFIAASDVGVEKTTLIIVPCNLLKSAPDVDFAGQPAWLPQLYQTLKTKLARYPLTSSG